MDMEEQQKLIKKIIAVLIAIVFLSVLLPQATGFFIFWGIILFIVFKNVKIKEFILDKFNNKFSSLGHQRKYVYTDPEGRKNITNMIQFGKKSVMAVIGLVILILLAIRMIVIIPAGATGVYSLFGKVGDNELSSGLHIINPFGSVSKMSIQTEEYTMSSTAEEGKVKGNDAIKALTKEGLEVSMDITVLYHLDEKMASDVYKNIGANYDEKIIRPEIRATIREIVANYNAVDIYTEKRIELTQKIQEKLMEVINQRGIIMESMLLRNVTLPAGLTKSIEEKLQADQEAQQMDFVLDKEKKEAERKRIQAAGQRDAQKIINESLTDKYLNYLYVNELKDRQGTIYVPVSPSTGMPMFKNIP